MGVAAAIAVAAAVTYDQGEKNRAAAGDAAKEQQYQQKRLEAEAIKRRTQEESNAKNLQARNEARNRQRQAAANSQGRRSTILTSPLGVTTPAPQVGGKDLLGS